MTNEVVPFGKYKGQPIDVMAQDKEYCDWLAAQAWFRSQFGGIHTLIVNNFGKPSDTPEHNALQAKFTNRAWAERFYIALLGKPTFDKDFRREANHCLKALEQEKDGLVRRLSDPERYFSAWGNNPDEKRSADVSQAKDRLDILIKQIQWITTVEPFCKAEELEFEANGADVSVSFSFGGFSYGRRIRIECKPSMSDDYPAVLRQMKKHDTTVLLIGDGGFSAQGATLAQVRAIFATAGISIVFLSDIL